MKRDVIIIGAGASGLLCAWEAAKRGRRVSVIDHMKTSAGKVRISGGGRCNFTNTNLSAENYVSGNPDFCRSALSRFGPSDFIELLESHGIAFEEKADGQLFCKKGSREVINMLNNGCESSGVEFLFETTVRKIRKDVHFEVSTDKGSFLSESLVIATGGLSYPSLGATGLGYRTAKSFGLNVTTLRPGLAPLELNTRDADVFGILSGISVSASISCKNARYTDKMLFTHRGLSGPAVLQISLFWSKGDTVTIDLLPGIDTVDYLSSKDRSDVSLGNALSAFFPKRFIRCLLPIETASRPLRTFSLQELRGISQRLHEWAVIPNSTGGYDKAEVTIGGVDTRGLSSKTMEAIKVQGLYFIGEVLDVTGQLGGYNLQWAWSSGYAAGQYA